MKSLIILTFLTIALLLLMPGVLTLLTKEIPLNQQLSFEGTERIFGPTVLSQSFFSPGGNLSAVGMSIKNAYFANKNDLEFRVLVNEQEVRKVIINGQNIADGDLMRIKFNPITVTKGERVEFMLTSPNSTAEHPFEVYISDDQDEFSHELKFNDRVVNGKIAYVLYNSGGDKLGLLKETYLGVVARLYSDVFFMIIYLLLIGSCVSTLSLLERKS